MKTMKINEHPIQFDEHLRKSNEINENPLNIL